MGTITRSFANLITASGPSAVANGSITAADLASGVGGKVLQVVSATTTTTVTVTTTTLTDTTLTASITPSSTSNKILVLVCQSIQAYNSGGNYATAKWTLLRGATTIWEPANGDNGNIFFYDYGGSGLNLFFVQQITLLDSPSTTSSTTYKTQIAKGANGGSSTAAQPETNKSSITLIEIAG